MDNQERTDYRIGCGALTEKERAAIRADLEKQAAEHGGTLSEMLAFYEEHDIPSGSGRSFLLYRWNSIAQTLKKNRGHVIMAPIAI